MGITDLKKSCIAKKI